ncbi:hypothetical protein GCM10011515_03100 [Tsuneonella deserti]|uniref:SHOCT domain-containing protein n=1 Tax=Tsuneonella deserti TaxID=2035528 RepID=A0ABQ1RZ56_9SPHN|nr:SHOCT domain-containing protein [Tsuneonella deserti]GGD86995.1 hypothetical protein GCM10011515_03100 [Tsuneonella deserti]
MDQGHRVELLERLARLHSEGALTEGEYAAEKARLNLDYDASRPTAFEHPYVRNWKPALLVGAALGLLTVAALWLYFPRGTSRPVEAVPTTAASRPATEIRNDEAVTGSTTAKAQTAQTNPTDTPDDQSVYLDQCHMGECSWTRSVAVNVIQRNQSERLLEVSSVSGSSEHDGDYPSSYSKGLEIHWDAKPSKTYVLCSKARPAVAYPYEGTFILDFLDLFEVYGYQTTAATTYLRTCHSLDYHAGQETRLRNLGYRPGTPSEQLRDRANIDELRPT